MGELTGYRILVVEEQPLVALDVQTALEAAGAEALVVGDTAGALAHIERSNLSAAILDLKPGSNEHRTIGRALNAKGVPFLFHSTALPVDVTTTRGAPVLLKPVQPGVVVKAVSLLFRER